MKKMNKLIITPKTKVLELIEAYPELEDVLIEYAPAFEKLKNPILRKTVAKIATLQQAAAIGNVKTEELINRMRKEVGQELIAGEAGASYIYEKPIWFDAAKITNVFNASEMLAAGEQPVNQIMADLKEIGKGEIYHLIAPFLTAPVIDKATSLGLKHWIEKQGEEKFNIYFLND